MQVFNVHHRAVRASEDQAGKLLDTLSSPTDAVWPSEFWPKMKLNGPLAEGAAGGHGPIRYIVQEYRPGRCAKFQFTGPRGFNGWHALEVQGSAQQGAKLVHTIKMNTTGMAIFLWPVVFRPLHDALLEDALSKAQASLGERPQKNKWSLRVQALRWLLSIRRPTA
jgi:hypothetical protein